MSLIFSLLISYPISFSDLCFKNKQKLCFLSYHARYLYYHWFLLLPRLLKILQSCFLFSQFPFLCLMSSSCVLCLRFSNTLTSISWKHHSKKNGCSLFFRLVFLFWITEAFLIPELFFSLYIFTEPELCSCTLVIWDGFSGETVYVSVESARSS